VKEVIMTMTMVKRTVVGILMMALIVGTRPVAAADTAEGRVGAYQTASWSVWVSAGWHTVTVVGDHDTDLDLYVYNAAGQRVAADDDPTDICVGRFFMPRGGYIQVRVRNLGSVYNEYVIDVD
jgi:hypothetical protein